jgi:hypothetical protein
MDFDPDQPGDEHGRWTAAGSVDQGGEESTPNRSGGASSTAVATNLPHERATDSPAANAVNITCEDLLESDYAICNSAAFEDDHHYRGLCVSNALLRNRQMYRWGSPFRRFCRISEVAMLDINQMLADMVTAIQSHDFPDGSTIASTLGLDLSGATITRTDNGAIAITGARLPESTAEVGVAGASTPRKTLNVVFFGSTIPVGPCAEAAAGLGQHIEQSKHGRGFAIEFRIDGFDCGLTASERGGVVETLFCAAPAVAA